MGATPGPSTVLSAQKEVAIIDVLVYAGSHYLGVTTEELKENACKWCSGGRDVPSYPDKGLGCMWIKAIFQWLPRLTLRFSRIYE